MNRNFYMGVDASAWDAETLAYEASERINTPDGIKLRVNRSIQVEGAFGVIKEDYGFRKFLTRGKRKTETQFFLLAFAYNIRKLCNRLETGRFGVALFDVDVA